jgi:hypothetical protein
MLGTSVSFCRRGNTVPEEAHVFLLSSYLATTPLPPSYHSFFLTSLLVFLLSMVQHIYASLGGGGYWAWSLFKYIPFRRDAEVGVLKKLS